MKRLWLLFITALTLGLIIPFSVVRAQVNTPDWEHVNGPYGGIVKAIGYTSNGSLVIGTNQGGIFRSINNGGKWLRSNLSDVTVSAFVLDATGAMLAATDNGIYRSFDQGNMWYRSSKGITANSVLSLAVDKKGIIYAGTNSGIYVSYDNSLNWDLLTSPPASLSFYSLKIASTNVVVAGTSDGVYRSDTSGLIWFRTGLAGMTVLSVALPDTAISFAGTRDSGLYRCDNNGINWYPYGYNNTTINVLAYSPAGYFYVGTNSTGIFVSTDLGASWSSSLLTSVPIYTLNTHKVSQIHAGTAAGYYLSSDLGDSWRQSNNGLTALTINALARDDQGNGYVATENQGLFRTSNNGDTWLTCANSPFDTYRTLAITSDGTIFAGDEAIGIIRSTDNGITWAPSHAGITGDAITQLVANQAALYAVVSNSGIYQSLNSGASWSLINPPVAGATNALAFGIDPDGDLFTCIAGYGIYFSNDDASTWTDVGTGLPSSLVQAFGFDSSGNVYASISLYGLYSSTNKGNTWNSTGFNQQIMSIATAPTGTMYAAVRTDGIYKSTNGTLWAPYNNGLTTSTIKSIIFSPSGLIYAGSEGNGLYVSSYRTFGGISGLIFFDRNRNRIYDSNDTRLPGWIIIAQRLNPDDTSVVNTDTTITDTTGTYTLENLRDGMYSVSQIQQDGWIQTYPKGRGRYIITIKNHILVSNLDFGNKRARNFTGTAGSNWSNPSNWEDGTIPNDTDAVTIPVDVIYDVPTTGIVYSLRISNSGKIHFSPTAGPLIINDRLEIDSTSTFSLSTGGTNPFVLCNGDWVNYGTFEAGTSTIVFSGNGAKTIVNVPPSTTYFTKKSPNSTFASGGQFYNLTISGDSTYTDGNVIVTNQLTLSKPLLLGTEDTLSITNIDVGAIIDTGTVPEGTIQRAIGGSGDYRFESPNTTVLFHETGTKPTVVTMTSFPGQELDTATLWYERKGGTVDTTFHTVTVDGIDHFSKWVLGIPGSGFRKATRETTGYLHTSASRMYAINADGGNGFSAKLKLRYDVSELLCTDCQSELELLRGPYVIDTAYDKWNLISLPLLVENNAKSAVFPTAASLAFTYDGGYVTDENLTMGKGYWLKFSGEQQLAILGTDVESLTVTVRQGWNMIGAASLPVAPSTVTSSPEGIITSSFFGYTNGYNIVGALEPLHAYWVNVNSDGILTLNANASAPTSKASSLQNELSSLSALSVRDALGSEQILYFGTRTQTPEKYIMPPVPPTGIFDIRYATDRIAEFGEEGTSKEVALTISSAEYPLTFSWNTTGSSTFASIVVNGTITALTSRGTIHITDPSTRVAIRFSGTEATPKQYALNQNYPNPFNPATTISFALPNDEVVNLKIYNILGQQVTSLLENVVYKAGSYTVQLNTTGWASGMYFYRIQAGHFVQTKKMLLTK